MDRPAEYSIKFRLGWSLVSAVGRPVHDGFLDDHGLRVSIARDVWSRALSSPLFPGWFGSMTRNVLGRVWPAYILPGKVIVKEMKPEEEEEFDHEKHIYGKLKSLQGHLTPVLYGEAQFEGKRSLILSDVDGVLPFNQTRPYLAPEEFQKRVEVAMSELQGLGLTYEDPKLENILLVGGGRLMFVDLGSVREMAAEKLDNAVQVYTQDFVWQYKKFLARQENEVA